jgi:hypothetical protein
VEVDGWVDVQMVSKVRACIGTEIEEGHLDGTGPDAEVTEIRSRHQLNEQASKSVNNGINSPKGSAYKVKAGRRLELTSKWYHNIKRNKGK